MFWSLGFVVIVWTTFQGNGDAIYRSTHSDVITNTWLDTSILEILSARSVIECESECMQTPGCIALNYARNMTCYLMTGDNGSLITNTEFWLIRPQFCLKVGSKCMSGLVSVSVFLSNYLSVYVCLHLCLHL